MDKTMQWGDLIWFLSGFRGRLDTALAALIMRPVVYLSLGFRALVIFPWGHSDPKVANYS